MIEYAHLNNDNEDYVYDGSNIQFAGKKQRLKTGGLANSRGTTSSQLYHHWMAPELISCNAPYCQNSCRWCVCDISVCVGGLTLGLAAKHKFQEKDRQHKKRVFSWLAQHLHVAGRWANCISSVVKAALLLTCAVIFLLQEDFFSVVTPRAWYPLL